MMRLFRVNPTIVSSRGDAATVCIEQPQNHAEKHDAIRQISRFTEQRKHSLCVEWCSPEHSAEMGIGQLLLDIEKQDNDTTYFKNSASV